MPVTRPQLPQNASKVEMLARERSLFAQRQLYEWSHAPGQPPYVAVVPPDAQWSPKKNFLWNLDMDTSLADFLLALVARFRKHNDTVESFRRYYLLRKIPATAERWMQNEEFGRERLNGVNPFSIYLAKEIPENFPVTTKMLEGILPSDVTLEQLLGERRLFLLDYRELAGVPLVVGRFMVPAMALFWIDDAKRLMPLAIQLGQSPEEAHEVIFTQKDPKWTWLMARAHVQCADAAYHEIIAHLTKTHLVMETFAVAMSRSLPEQHPLYQLLKPHFTGTLEVNHLARAKLIAPGGPIDLTIAAGSEGGLDLVARAYAKWSFEDWNPRTDFEKRGVLDPDVVPHFYYRDDALHYLAKIENYAREFLRVFYRNEDDVKNDTDLQA